MLTSGTTEEDCIVICRRTENVHRHTTITRQTVGIGAHTQPDTSQINELMKGPFLARIGDTEDCLSVGRHGRSRWRGMIRMQFKQEMTHAKGSSNKIKWA